MSAGSSANEESESKPVETGLEELEKEDEVQEIPPPEGGQASGWRKSLDMVKGSLGWAFRGLSVEVRVTLLYQRYYVYVESRRSPRRKRENLCSPV